MTGLGSYVNRLLHRVIRPIIACIPLLLLGALSGCAFEFTPEPIPPAFPSHNLALPVSGYEFEFAPILWNDGGDIQKSTNCYAYMLNRRTGFEIGHKLQPGELSGDPLDTAEDINVSKIIELVRADADIAGFYFEESDRRSTCSDGTYKVALVVDPEVDTIGTGRTRTEPGRTSLAIWKLPMLMPRGSRSMIQASQIETTGSQTTLSSVVSIAQVRNRKPSKTS